MAFYWQAISSIAIASGGALSAFTAGRSKRATSWLSAYLVIVVGLLQWGLVAGFGWPAYGPFAPPGLP